MPRNHRAGAAFLTAVLVLAVLGACASVFLWRHGIRSRAERDARAAARWSAIRVESRLADARLATPVRVAVLADPASNRWFNGPATLDTVTRTWLTALRDIGADAHLVAPGALAEIRGVDVLVIPSSPCLGAPARAAVDTVLARGGGVISTWLTGTRDAVCGDAGLQFITRLSAASRVDTLDRRARTLVTMPDGGVLAADIPPGGTFEIRSAHDAALRRVGRDAYYTDGMFNPAPAAAQPGLDGAVAHTTLGAGRAVYWGFDLAQVVNRPWDHKVASLLLRNSVAWAAGNTLVSVAPWPAGRRAAVVVVQQVDSAVERVLSRDTATLSATHGTFFFATNTARDEQDIIRKLARKGEIASRPDDELRIARTDEEQTEKFRTLRTELADVAGRPVAGMMPPMERLDPLLALAWARAGGSYLLAGNGARSAGPELLSVDSLALVLLPRLAGDDAAALRERTTSVATVSAAYRDALAKLRALGGLYVMRHHASLLARDSLAAAVEGAVGLVTADSTVWVATANEVAGWWLGRSRLAVASSAHADGGLEIRIGNNGPTALEGAVLRIVNPRGRRITIEDGAVLGARRGESVELLLPRIDAGGDRTVRLRMSAGNAASAR